MASLSNRVDRNQILPGDHIYAWRKGYTYAHHGIYVGDNLVIHFLSDGNSLADYSSSPIGRIPCPNCPEGRNTGVVQSCLDCFLYGGRLCRYQYGVSSFQMSLFRGGTCATVKSLPSDDVIRRAQDLLNSGAPERYNLFTNNCEQFSLYCKTGVENLPCGQSHAFVNDAVGFAKAVAGGLTIAAMAFAAVAFAGLVVAGTITQEHQTGTAHEEGEEEEN